MAKITAGLRRWPWLFLLFFGWPRAAKGSEGKEVEAWGCPFVLPLRRFPGRRGLWNPPWGQGLAIKQPWHSSGRAVRMRLLPALVLALLLLLSSSVPAGGEFLWVSVHPCPSKRLDRGIGCPR